MVFRRGENLILFRRSDNNNYFIINIFIDFEFFRVVIVFFCLF